VRHIAWRGLFKGFWRTAVVLAVTAACTIGAGIVAGGPSLSWLVGGSVLSLFAAVPGYLLYRIGAPEHTAGNRIVMLLVLMFTAWLGALLVLPVYMSREGVPTDAAVTGVARANKHVSEHRLPVYRVAERGTGKDLGQIRFLDAEPKVGAHMRVRVDPRGWFNVTIVDPVGRFIKLAALVVLTLGVVAFFLGIGGHMPD